MGCRLAGSWFAIVLISVCALAFGGAVILFDSYEFLGSPAVNLNLTPGHPVGFHSEAIGNK